MSNLLMLSIGYPELITFLILAIIGLITVIRFIIKGIMSLFNRK